MKSLLFKIVKAASTFNIFSLQCYKHADLLKKHYSCKMKTVVFTLMNRKFDE